MNIENYYNIQNSQLSFTRKQASDFAKNVAGDFNPIHDIDSKRFCVPGDLLFSVILHHYGLKQNMTFNFSGMVNESTTLILPERNQKNLSFLDMKDKKYLSIECDGEVSNDNKLIESLSRNYVEFSGNAFIDNLVPLMQEHHVMINPARPLVIYESMSFQLTRLDIDSIQLELAKTSLTVNGKRGDVDLEYHMISDGTTIGHGCKKMVLSGLRDYDQVTIDQLVAFYNQRRDSHTG